MSKRFTEQDAEPAENIRQFYNRTRNRQIFRVSSRSGTGRNFDPLEQCRIVGQEWTGQNMTGHDRIGQDRTGQDWI